MDLTDIYKTFPLTAAEYKFLSSAQGTFSRICHTLGHKTIVNKCKNIEIIPSILSYHGRIKLEMSNRRKIGKFTNT